MERSTVYGIVFLFGVSVTILFYMLFIKQDSSTIVVGRTIEIISDVPPETLLVDKWRTRYVTDPTSFRIIDSLEERLKANDTTARDYVLEKLQPFSAKGKSQYYEYDITAHPLTRSFFPFVINALPFKVDTTFMDTTIVYENTNSEWYAFALGGGLITLLIIILAGN